MTGSEIFLDLTVWLIGVGNPRLLPGFPSQA